MRCNEWNENGGRLHGEDEGGLSFALQAWQGHWRKERETEVGHEVEIYAIQRSAKVFFLGCVTLPLRPEASNAT